MMPRGASTAGDFSRTFARARARVAPSKRTGRRRQGGLIEQGTKVSGLCGAWADAGSGCATTMGHIGKTWTSGLHHQVHTTEAFFPFLVVKC